MSEFERKILERLAALETEVKQLKSGKTAAEKAVEFERLPPTATVGKDYVAYRFGCSEEAVVRGRAGTDRLNEKRVSDKPLKWIKRDVDAEWSDYTRPAKDKAAEARAKAPTRKPRSIITKRAA